jgi:drug/metabolite transporter (DMT)-like permease
MTMTSVSTGLSVAEHPRQYTTPARAVNPSDRNLRGSRLADDVSERRPHPYLVLAAAVLAVSWAAPLIRLTAAPALAIAAWRLTISSLLLLPLFLRGGNRAAWRGLGVRGRWTAVAAGLALALHFASWITSLRLTSVAASAVLVSLSPVFAWLFSHLFLGERPTRVQGSGIVLAVGGAAVIALGGARAGGGAVLLGDLLALAGAACGAAYLVIGRRLRARLGLVAYVTPVYGVAALVLLAWAAARGEAFRPYALGDWAVFAALAAGPMLVGHTGFNYALRYLPAFTVNVGFLAEPVGATLIAWVLPAIAEAPSATDLGGGAIVLAGVMLTMRGTPRTEAAAPPPP